MKIRADVKKEFPKDKMLAELHEIRLRLLEDKKSKRTAGFKDKKSKEITAASP